MRKKPATICPTCGKLKRGRCTHCGKAPGWGDDRFRGSRIARGYGRDWQKLRARKVVANPLCEECERHGRITITEEVHHIISFRGLNDPLRLDWDNLRSVCKACHAVLTGERNKRSR